MSAAQKYDDRIAQARAQIARLSAMLNQHERLAHANAAQGPMDWGYVGDLNHMIEVLDGVDVLRGES